MAPIFSRSNVSRLLLLMAIGLEKVVLFMLFMVRTWLPFPGQPHKRASRATSDTDPQGIFREGESLSSTRLNSAFETKRYGRRN